MKKNNIILEKMKKINFILTSKNMFFFSRFFLLEKNSFLHENEISLIM